MSRFITTFSEWKVRYFNAFPNHMRFSPWSFGAGVLRKLQKQIRLCKRAPEKPSPLPGVRASVIVLIGMAILAALIGTSGIVAGILSDGSGQRIVIAGKHGAEAEILINMYKILIEEHTDLNVELKPDYGTTFLLYETLKSGGIDVYPEYSGTITGTLLHRPVEVSNAPRQVYEAARDSIYAQDRLIYLEPSKYQNTYAIAIRRDFSEKFDLIRISDLAKVSNSVKAGFSPEFNSRDDGNPGLKRVYGLNLEVEVMDAQLRYEALERRDIQVIETSSTDSALKRYDLVVLTDDENLFPSYQVAPLLREDTLKRHPKLQKALEQLSGRITEQEMSEMNYAVDMNRRTPEDIAYDYLKLKGLID